MTLLKCYKESYSLSLMCKYTRNKDHALHKICSEVEAMTFTSKPDYLQIRQILQSLITHEQQKIFEFICLKSYKLERLAGTCSMDDVES